MWWWTARPTPTVLTLSHWPQLPAPDGLADDLSAQMAFRCLDSGATLHGNAEVITNNLRPGRPHQRVRPEPTR